MLRLFLLYCGDSCRNLEESSGCPLDGVKLHISYIYLITDKKFVEIHNSMLGLNNESTIYMAEMTAIQKAVDYYETNLVNKDVHIISGSFSALTPNISVNEDWTLIVSLRK